MGAGNARHIANGDTVIGKSGNDVVRWSPSGVRTVTAQPSSSMSSSLSVCRTPADVHGISISIAL